MKRGLILVLLTLLILSPMLIVAAAESNVTNSSGNILKQEVQIPEQLMFLEILVGWITAGVEHVSWELLIVTIMTIVIVFVLVLGILDLTAFETEWVKYTIALGVSVILSMTGVVRQIPAFIISVTKSIQGWNRLWVILGVMIIMILAVIARNIITHRRRIDDAKARGILAGSTLKNLRKLSEEAAKAASGE